MITPDYEDTQSCSNFYHHHAHAHSEHTLIIDLRTSELVRSMQARCDQRFAFDPRFGAADNASFFPRVAEFDAVRGQIVDLATQKVVVSSTHTLKTKVCVK